MKSSENKNRKYEPIINVSNREKICLHSDDYKRTRRTNDCFCIIDDTLFVVRKIMSSQSKIILILRSCLTTSIRNTHLMQVEHRRDCEGIRVVLANNVCIKQCVIMEANGKIYASRYPNENEYDTYF